MAKLHRQFALRLLKYVRQSPLRAPIVGLLIKTHNFSYHWISFFVSHAGTHPKHAIINYHKFFLDNISDSDSVIDLGCGAGEVTYDIAHKAATVVGVDINPESIERAKVRYIKNNLSFSVQDITVMHKRGTFDVAILSNVLEHVENRNDFLQATKILAKKILIRVPLVTRDWLSVYKKEHNFEYRLDDTHFIEYSEQSFRDEITKANLRVTHLHAIFGELYAVCESTAIVNSPVISSIARSSKKQVAC